MTGNIVANDADAAGQAKTKMADVVASIQDILKKIDATVTESDAVFQGTASKAFQDASAEWHAKFTKMNDALNHMHESVGQGTDAFANVDTDNESSFKSALTNLA